MGNEKLTAVVDNKGRRTNLIISISVIRQLLACFVFEFSLPPSVVFVRLQRKSVQLTVLYLIFFVHILISLLLASKLLVGVTAFNRLVIQKYRPCSSTCFISISLCAILVDAFSRRVPKFKTFYISPIVVFCPWIEFLIAISGENLIK